jgi:predicted O-methyltransferase YrrM
MSYNSEDNNIDGWMTRTELDWLYAKACEMESAVEVGSWEGRSSHALLSGCKGTVWCVDHFKGSPSEINETHKRATEEDISKLFSDNVGHFQNLILMKMESTQAAKMFLDKSVDMVFLDGAHDFESINADIKAWLPKAKKLICGHDADQEGVPQALKENFPDGHEKEAGGFWAVYL